MYVLVNKNQRYRIRNKAPAILQITRTPANCSLANDAIWDTNAHHAKKTNKTNVCQCVCVCVCLCKSSEYQRPHKHK